MPPLRKFLNIHYTIDYLFPPSALTDIDGNVYKTVRIGGQVWTAENIRTTHYNDNTPITFITDNNEWLNDRQGAYCYFNHTTNQDDQKKYGALYNWFALRGYLCGYQGPRLAPVGWHVPNYYDWSVLGNYLKQKGYYSWYAGQPISVYIAKSLASKTDWKLCNEEATPGYDMASNNRSHFNGLPASFRLFNGTFAEYGAFASWWRADGFNPDFPMIANAMQINYNYGELVHCTKEVTYGLSVRLVKD